MTLIDKDALIAKTDYLVGDRNGAAWLQWINEAPEISPKHGEWNSTYKSGYEPSCGCVCSACDCWSDRDSKFCPNCGAYMKGANHEFDRTYLVRIIGELNVEGHSEAEVKRAIEEFPKNLKNLLEDELGYELSDTRISVLEVEKE